MTSLIKWIVAACARHHWLVIAVAATICAGAFRYVAQHIAIDTDTTKLIAEDVAWRQRELMFDAAFPHRGDLIAVVVDAANRCGHMQTFQNSKLPETKPPIKA